MSKVVTRPFGHNPLKPQIMIAVPSYSQVEGEFSASMASAVSGISEHFSGQITYLLGTCHVDDARNQLVRLFMETECEHLIFIDADISFTTRELRKLLAADGDVVGATYRHKKDEESYPMLVYGESFPDKQGLVEVTGLPTGFMKISRRVFENLQPRTPFYKTQNSPDPEYLHFCRTIDHGIRVSGDIAFCKKVKALGMSVKLVPDIYLGHTGPRTWYGSVYTFNEIEQYGPYKAYLRAVKEKRENDQNYLALFKEWGNEYTWPTLVKTAAMVAKDHKNIIEFGSGLTTIVMAAQGAFVTAIEEFPEWGHKVEEVLKELNLQSNVKLIYSSRDVNGRYSYDTEAAGEQYDICLVDGPSMGSSNSRRDDCLFVDAKAYIFDDGERPYVRDTIAKLCEEKGLEQTEITGKLDRQLVICK